MTLQKPVSDIASRERERLKEQALLDGQRSSKERNLWGQFATPPSLAHDIVKFSLSFHKAKQIRFLEPSCGSGSFFSALLNVIGSSKHLEQAIGVELDERFAAVAERLWGECGLRVIQGDYTQPGIVPPGWATLLIANPPYVRHHHIDAATKAQLVARSVAETGLKPSGLSGLYLYFMLLSHRALAPGAVSAWLIPAEFMDVNYGRAIKTYLTQKVTLRRVHRFDPADVQFDDALVTSAVVVFENVPPSVSTTVELTHGGTISEPRTRIRIPNSSLVASGKWSTHFRKVRALNHSDPVLADFFQIRRGIATGANKFFIMPRAEASTRGFQSVNLKPVLPGARYLRDNVIQSDDEGYPLIDPQLVLIDTSAQLDELKHSDPALAEYLAGADTKVRSGYLVKKRTPWYRQEQRPPAPFLCTYMGRSVNEKHPFRFILNRSRALATNTYLLLYPNSRLQAYIDGEPNALDKLHSALLSLMAEDLRNSGRIYGGGLHKMEPAELAALRATVVADLLPGV